MEVYNYFWDFHIHTTAHRTTCARAKERNNKSADVVIYWENVLNYNEKGTTTYIQRAVHVRKI